MQAVLTDVGLCPDDIDQVVIGNALYGGGNPARLMSLAAGLPESIPALTVDTQCCSGLDALRLGAQASLMGQPVTLDLARDLLDRMNIDQGAELNTEYIMEVVARAYDVTPRDIKGNRRTRAISKPRQYAMYLARKHTDHSYPQLGDQFGGKDHTTVLAACKKIGGLLEDGDEDMTAIIEGLENKLLR
jgi:chromosomal replication initiation ATPase DnaA